MPGLQTINPNTPTAGPVADVPPLISHSPTPTSVQPQLRTDTYTSQTPTSNTPTTDQQILTVLDGLTQTPPPPQGQQRQQNQDNQTTDDVLNYIDNNLLGGTEGGRQQDNGQGGRSLFSFPSLIQGISAPLAISGARAAQLGLQTGIGSWVNAGGGTARVLTLGGAGYIAPGIGAGFALFDVGRDWYRLFTFNGGSYPQGSTQRREAEERRSGLRTNAIANSLCTVLGGIAGAILLRNSAGWKLGALLGTGLGNIVGNLFKSMTSAVSGIGRAIGRFLF